MKQRHDHSSGQMSQHHQQSVMLSSISISVSSSSPSLASSAVTVTSIEQPKILENGKAIQVFFPRITDSNDNDTNESKIYHAPWLWVNDTSNFMKPSGQKIRSPGTFKVGTKIQDARIELQNYDASSLIGSVHPFRQDEGDGNNDWGSDESSNRSGGEGEAAWTLIITWSTMTDKGNNDKKTSTFDLTWLKQWSYDHQSIVDAIQEREVKTSHTFIHKFKSSNLTNVNDDDGDDNSHHAQPHPFRLRKHLGIRHVTYEHFKSSNNKMYLDGNEVEKNNQDGLFDALDAIFLDGAVLVTNIPQVSSATGTNEDVDTETETHVIDIGKMVGSGSLSHSALYGSTFHVRSTANAINVAYTSAELCPHQDLAYYESKPGLQLLHCITNDRTRITGGESILIDAMAAAHTFRSIAPDYFDVLTKCNATFVKQREGAIMTYTRPHIELAHHHSRDGTGTGTANNSSDKYKEIVAIHWAPPFEGPLSISPELINPYFEAYSAFELMLDNSIDPKQRSLDSNIDLDLAIQLAEYANMYTWEYVLHPGEMIIFNNTRMLHGRREFKEKATEAEKKMYDTVDDCCRGTARHLVGAYTNIDDSLNCYRVILRAKKMKKTIPNVGNGTTSVLPL